MANRNIFDYGAAGSVASQDAVSQDRVSRSSPQRVETAWGESARWPEGTALPCRAGVTAKDRRGGCSRHQRLELPTGSRKSGGEIKGLDLPSEPRKLNGGHAC